MNFQVNNWRREWLNTWPWVTQLINRSGIWIQVGLTQETALLTLYFAAISKNGASLSLVGSVTRSQESGVRRVIKSEGAKVNEPGREMYEFSLGYNHFKAVSKTHCLVKFISWWRSRGLLCMKPEESHFPGNKLLKNDWIHNTLEAQHSWHMIHLKISFLPSLKLICNLCTRIT